MTLVAVRKDSFRQTDKTKVTLGSPLKKITVLHNAKVIQIHEKMKVSL